MDPGREAVAITPPMQGKKEYFLARVSIDHGQLVEHFYATSVGNYLVFRSPDEVWVWRNNLRLSPMTLRKYPGKKHPWLEPNVTITPVKVTIQAEDYPL